VVPAVRVKEDGHHEGTVKLGYEFCYLYTAIAPQSGHLLALILPQMTKVCFAVFIDFFKEQTQKLYGDLPVLLIADQAGSHQPHVCVQRGIAFEPLPTACPELNPVERFFEELRKELSNKIFETIEAVEDFVSTILVKYWQHPELVIQLCQFPSIRST
jgi:transposase